MPDSDNREPARIYGQADDANRTPAGPQGVRGENNPNMADPEFAHEETVGDGRRVVLEETNGVAFAEATGRAGLEAQHEHQRREGEK